MAARHHVGAAPFEKAGGFAPTMGIIGTVMGLVHVLQNLSAPSTLGPSISCAFIATLMGVGSANVIYLPVANRLKALSAEEVELRTLTVDGILSVQAGDNPRVVADKLTSYVPPPSATAERAAQTRADAGQREAEAACDGRRAARGGAARRPRPRHENEERWLLTYADMITLLMALFMVLFSISSVNISKYQPAAVAEGGVLGLDPAGRPVDPPVRRGLDRRPHARHGRGPADRAADPDAPKPTRSAARARPTARLPSR